MSDQPQKGLVHKLAIEKNPLANRVKPNRNKTNKSWIVMIGSLMTIPAISGDMYLPSLPDLAIEFNTTETFAQMTVSMTMLGAAFGQLIVGPLLDKFGRRRPVLVGLGIHVLMSICCALSSSIYALFVFRFFQGAANASANVTGMAVSRDLFKGAKGVQMMSRFMLVLGVAPLFAPSLGTLMLDFGGWRAVFVLLGIVGLALLIYTYFHLPQTMPQEFKKDVGFVKLVGLYKSVFKDRKFVCLSICSGCAMCFLMTWVVSSPFITQTEWHFSPLLFSLTFALNGCFLVGGAQIVSAIAKKVPSRVILRSAISAQLLILLVMVILALILKIHSPLLLIPMFLAVLVQNAVTSNSFNIAMENQASQAGTASAVMGILNCLGSASSPIICGFYLPLVGGSWAMAMSATMFTVVAISFAVMVLGTDVFRRGKVRRKVGV